MPIAVAQYLRHLATRCSRMSRDCHDPVVAKELEIISFELVEKAVEMDALFRIPGADPGDALSSDVICTDSGDDDAK